jgi:hypothetical protein
MAVEIERTNKSTGKKETRLYETVAERVRKFRDKYPIESRWSILTTIEFPSEQIVFASTEVHNPEGKILANGHAEENRTIGDINATSAVENAETSAIGRALFSAGFGGGEFCSADELVEALKKQEQLKGAEKKALPNSANNNADTRKTKRKRDTTKAKQKPAKTSPIQLPTNRNMIASRVLPTQRKEISLSRKARRFNKRVCSSLPDLSGTV